MSSLCAQGISFSFTDAVPLFRGATFRLESGWTGLVGGNGAGKTTLLRVLAGELHATEGQVRREAADARVLLCEQRVEAAPPGALRLADSWEPEDCRLRATLGLEEAELSRWPTLSPGERRRWQVGAALAANPDVLLLDEPGNHLDAEGLAFLTAALRRFRGVGVIVSHQRGLLDALTQQTLRLASGEVRLFAGSYSSARTQWEAERERKLEAFTASKDGLERTRQELHRNRQALAAASAQRNAGRRMKDPNDHDGSSMGRDFAAARAEKRLGRDVAVVRRKEKRAEQQVARFDFEKEVGREVFAGYEPCPRPAVLQLSGHDVAAGERVLLKRPSLLLGRSDRVHLAGANGAGKTTLLRALMAASPAPEGRLLYLPQDTSSVEAEAALDSVRSPSPELRGQVLSLVAALGVDPGRLLGSCSPSPGEARKLLIAEGLGRHVWALLLDEPTNHLDLPSIERLEAALERWPGALLVVTHDDALARAVCDTRWLITDGEVQVSSIG
ncbi:MAG: ATP-binding cassette domain-containing protein [Myxococcaceae bacterium]